MFYSAFHNYAEFHFKKIRGGTNVATVWPGPENHKNIIWEWKYLYLFNDWMDFLDVREWLAFIMVF